MANYALQSKVPPSDTLPLFYSDKRVKVVAKELGVSLKYLKRCWTNAFGEEAWVHRTGRWKRSKEDLATRDHGYYLKNQSRNQAAGRQYYSERRIQILSEKARQRKDASPESLLWSSAKTRANSSGTPFAISVEDVKQVLRYVCPVSLEPIAIGRGAFHPNSMSLDRVEPSKGYVVGNIQVISLLANRAKQDCSDPIVFRGVAEYLLNQASSVRREWTQKKTPKVLFRKEKMLLRGARVRSRERNLPFALTLGDILDLWPYDDRCPITGVVLCPGPGVPQPQSPTLDRVVPTLGYVWGNVRVISHKANTIKQSISEPQFFVRLAEYVETYGS